MLCISILVGNIGLTVTKSKKTQIITIYSRVYTVFLNILLIYN